MLCVWLTIHLSFSCQYCQLYLTPQGHHTIITQHNNAMGLNDILTSLERRLIWLYATGILVYETGLKKSTNLLMLYKYFKSKSIKHFFTILYRQVSALKEGGPAFLAHTKQKVSNIVGLTALRPAFFMGYE